MRYETVTLSLLLRDRNSHWQSGACQRGITINEVVYGNYSAAFVWRRCLIYHLCLNSPKKPDGFIGSRSRWFSLQIVLFVAPVLVLVSAFLGHPLDLEFNVFGMFAAVAAIFITNSISSDGQSSWIEGVLLLTLYVILGTAFYYHS